MPGPNDVPGRLRLPDSPAAPDHAHDLERLAAGDRGHPARWSRAELRDRLERLPPGHPSAARTDAPEHGQPRPDGQADAPARSYWTEVPRFQRAWADHVRNWPMEHLPPGEAAPKLNPEQHAKVKDNVARIRESEKALTGSVKEAAQSNDSGAWLEGLEHCLKGDDRTVQKVAEVLKRVPGKSVQEIVRELPDAIRYTFCLEAGNYAAGYWDVKHRMEQQGHAMIYSKNHWCDDPDYKGINTRWVTPDGQRFEVQFHTAESYHAKQEVTHRFYERLRSPLTPDDERRELRSFQREVCQWISIPEGATAIPDYRRRANT